MRRSVGSVFVVPAGALIAALTAVYAMAQPATRPLTLRPSIEDTSEERTDYAFQLILPEGIVELLDLVRRRNVDAGGHRDEGDPRLEIACA